MRLSRMVHANIMVREFIMSPEEEILVVNIRKRLSKKILERRSADSVCAFR